VTAGQWAVRVKQVNALSAMQFSQLANGASKKECACG
jgi:hypothetical protein